eukprot:jgi/Botrbrau1/9174/Bobra.0236s0006.1
MGNCFGTSWSKQGYAFARDDEQMTLMLVPKGKGRKADGQTAQDIIMAHNCKCQLQPLRSIPSGVEWAGSESFRSDYRMSDEVIRKFLQWGYI